MSKKQIIFLFISLLSPFANYAICNWFKNLTLKKIANKTLPTISLLACLVTIISSLQLSNIIFVPLKISDDVFVSFEVSLKAIFLLSFVNFFWFIYSFYGERFYFFLEEKMQEEERNFSLLVIGFISLSLFSHSLLSLLLFITILFLIKIYYIKTINNQDVMATNLVSFVTYFQFVLIFFFCILMLIYADGIALYDVGNFILSENYLDKFMLLFFLPAIFPEFIFYKKLNVEPRFNLILIFLKVFYFSILSLIIFSKTSNQIENLMIDYDSIFLAIAINFIFSSYLFLFSKGIKSSYFYFLFNQSSFLIFSLYIFLNFNISNILIPISSFILSIMAISFCVFNLIIFLTKSQSKNFNGLFYELTLTSSIMLVTMLCIIGIFPSINMLEKFLLLKIILQEKLWFALSIFITNIFVLFLFLWRFFIQLLFIKNEKIFSSEDKNLALRIDRDSILILIPSSILLTMICFGFWFFYKNFI